jgi:hypothetical protein
MSGRKVPADDVAVGDRIAFELEGEKRTAVVQQIREFQGKLRFDVETDAETFMVRQYEHGDDVTVLDGAGD